MAFDDDLELVEEYVQWKAIKKASTNDTSPGVFLVERAERAAYDKVEAALKFIKAYDDWDDDPAMVDIVNLLEA